ncbi:MAG: hypothetical protein GX989_05055 [Firmicutes bacterium]|mgnify:CR=1 FL=1|nr:hypothetical protein [Bacillota bacterium]
MAHHFGFILNTFNNTCITCGGRDFLEQVIVGETLSAEKLAACGVPVDEGVEVFICINCLLELCQ